MSVRGDETICVVGLGYVGLPTAIAFHSAGFNVIGVDVSESVLEVLGRGESPLIDSSSNLEIPVNSNRWSVTSDFADSVPLSDVILITVPTPVNNDNSPDLRFVESASKSVLKNINPDSLFLEREVPTYFHPNKSAYIKLGKFKKLGLFGELNPKLTNWYGFKNSPIIFSIFLEEIEEKNQVKKIKFENSPYPSVIRDFAFVVDEKIEVQNIVKTIRKIDKELIVGIKLFDVFEGQKAYEQIGRNKKSLAFEVIDVPDS